jgi:hypothetical protein
MAGRRTPPTIGEEVEEQFLTALRELNFAPLPGARDLPVLAGLSPKPIYTVPPDNVILKAIGHLVASGRVYAHGNDVAYEAEALDGRGPALHHLRLGSEMVPGASSRLANVFTCAAGDTLFTPPRSFVGDLLASDLLNGRLPRITTYATRPVFDADYILCGPGWHPAAGVLVHGPAVEPEPHRVCDPSAPALQRLPHHLRTLLAGFCFRSDADLVNAVSMFLTGLLANHFVDDPKGVFLVDGNQPNLGKALLVRTCGLVLDGVAPQLVTFLANDEELEKKICASLRGRWQSMVFLDNAKSLNGGVISSQVIEANSVAPEVSLRILGRSEMHTRPNDLLWVLTMNDTRVSPDLASRGVPVRLAYEGRPEGRAFAIQPLEYALRHRLKILGELAGMVVKWNQAGRPRGVRSHRSLEWAAVVGGILAAAGLPEFLENADEAASAFNVQLDDLAALAEAVVDGNGPFVELPNPEGSS